MKNNATPEVRFEGFEEDWEEKTLGEISDVFSGGTPSTSVAEYWGGNIDWYSPTEIGSKVYATGSVKKITELGLKKSSAKILPANKTILFTSRAGIGDMAILAKEGATNQGFQSIVLKENYDLYFMYSIGHKIKAFALKNASGSTFLEISGKMLSGAKLTIPKLQEQKKIGEFFKNLDETIAIAQKQILNLKQAKKGFLQKMFPKNGEKKPEVRFGGFETDWEEKTLGDSTQLLTSNLKASDVFKNGLFQVYDASGEIGYLDSYISKDAYFTIIKDGSGAGRARLLPPKSSFTSTLNGIKEVNNKTKLLFIFYSFLKIDFKKHLVGTGIPHIYYSSYKNEIILVPSLEEQQKIGEFFKNLDELIAIAQKELSNLQQAKKGFLQKMFV